MNIQLDNGDQLKPDPTIRQLLDRVARRFDDPKIKHKLTSEVEAELLKVIGNTYRAIGELEKAIDFLNRGTKLFEAAYGSEDPRTLCCRVKLGRARLQSGDSLAAIQLALNYLDSSDAMEVVSRLIELEKILKKSDYQSTSSIEILTRLADCLDKQAGDSTEIRDQIVELTVKEASKPAPKE